MPEWQVYISRLCVYLCPLNICLCCFSFVLFMCLQYRICCLWFCSYLCCFSSFCAPCVGGFYTCCISTHVYTPITDSSSKQLFNVSCSWWVYVVPPFLQVLNTFRWLSAHPHHPTWASIHPTSLLDTEYWKVLPSVFGGAWEARRCLLVPNIWAPWEFQRLSFGLSAVLHLLTHGSLFCGSSLHLRLKVCCSWQRWLCRSSARRTRRWVLRGLCSASRQQSWRAAADLCGVLEPAHLWQTAWPSGTMADFGQDVQMITCLLKW